MVVFERIVEGAAPGLLVGAPLPLVAGGATSDGRQEEDGAGHRPLLDARDLLLANRDGLPGHPRALDDRRGSAAGSAARSLVTVGSAGVGLGKCGLLVIAVTMLWP
jgi:hypothetical protein